MSVVVIGTLARGSTGDSPFPVVVQEDIKIGYMVTVDLAARDALPTWQRTQGMQVHVISEGKDYRLAVDLLTWTEVASSSAFQLLSEKNQAGGYVGLEVDGFINPAYIKSIYANTSYVVATLIERNNLATLTGDIIVVTDTSETFVKLNNNPAPNVDADFSLLSVGGAVLSVNGQVGTVTIDFNSMIAQGGSQAAFDAAVAATPSVGANTAQVVVNTDDITTIYALLAGLGTATDIAIPEFNNGVTYEDGFNVVYGPLDSKNLYRVKDGQGPVLGVLPSDPIKWEKIGDFYTKDETDALLLNLTANPVFNWNRTIKKLPEVGQIPGSNQLLTGMEEIYYGRIDTKVEIVSIDALQIGETIAPTINGKVIKGDALSIQQITILDDTNTPVGNPTFTGTDEVIEFSFQVSATILATLSSTLKYSIQVDSSYDAFLPVETIVSETQVITTVYPILFGAGATDLSTTDKYLVLQKLVEADGNKTVTLDSNNNKLYYCIPEAYANRLQILDETGSDILGSLFPNPPVIEAVTSDSLTADWTVNYKVYQANYDTDSSATDFTFVLDATLGVGNTLDDIAEGVINKHLTKSLKEKLVNFNGADYLTFAQYDSNADGIVSVASQLGFIGVNNTAGVIPANTLITFDTLNVTNGQLNISIANKDTPIPARAITTVSIAVAATGRCIVNGVIAPLDTSGHTIDQPVWLDSAGGITTTLPTSGLIQPVGRMLTIDATNGVVYINPQPIEDTNTTVNDWVALTFYPKDTVLAIDSNDLTGVPPNLLFYVRVVADYNASSSAQTDFTNGNIVFLGGDMQSSVRDPQGVLGDAYDMDNMADGLQIADPAIRKVTLTEDERQKLRDLQPSKFKGTFANPTALRAAFNTALDGDSANVTSTSTVWAWNSLATPTPPTTGGDWEDTSAPTGGGDMQSSTYDPGAKATVIWNTDNHDTGSVNAVYPIVDRNKLAGIEPGATADQTAAEIKVAYESNADTNAFLDAEKTKLTGIQTGAQADQSAAEVIYDNSGSGLAATDVKAGLDELDGTITSEQGLVMYKTAYDPNNDGVVEKAEELVTIAYNDEATNMNVGDAVYIDSVNVGNQKLAKWAQNTTIAKLPVLGIVLSDGATITYAPGDPMRVGVNGIFQTPTFGGFVVGDSLYLGASNTTGNLQNTEPVTQAGTILVIVAKVAGIASGQMFTEIVNINAYRAARISYDPATSSLLTTSVQAVIDELDAKVEALPAPKALVLGSIYKIYVVNNIGLNSGEVTLLNSTSLISNTTRPAAGRLAVDVACNVLISIDFSGENITNNDDTTFTLAINGIAQTDLAAKSSSDGGQGTLAGNQPSISYATTLAANDYISVFHTGDQFDLWSAQISISGQGI